MDKNNVILVTGCSNGFGRIMASVLPADGDTVYASMRHTESRNSLIKDEIEAEAKEKGFDLRVIDLDVTSNSSVKRAIEQIIEKSGRIDVLINNAGAMNSGLTEGFTIEQVKEQFDVNFFATVRTCRAVIPHMRRENKGLIIQLSSLAGRAVFPFFGIYCASKFAVEALAEAYHYELKSFGISSIIVEPGPYATGLFSAAPGPKDQSINSNYGKLSDIPGKLLKAFESAASGSDAPGPIQVSETIKNLIAMPEKDRPIRTIVSNNDFNVTEINNATIPVQNGILKGMGLEFMVP